MIWSTSYQTSLGKVLRQERIWFRCTGNCVMVCQLLFSGFVWRFSNLAWHLYVLSSALFQSTQFYPLKTRLTKRTGNFTSSFVLLDFVRFISLTFDILLLVLTVASMTYLIDTLSVPQFFKHFPYLAVPKLLKHFSFSKLLYMKLPNYPYIPLFHLPSQRKTNF